MKRIKISLGVGLVAFIIIAAGIGLMTTKASPGPEVPNPGHSWIEIGDFPGIIWHSNNDGSGSGLDADMVDGKHASELVSFWTDADGYIYPNNVGTNLQITDTGNVKIAGGLQLIPSSVPFSCNVVRKGSMYFDSGSNKHFICDGTSWNDYTGPQGPKGDKGATGPQGPQGPAVNTVAMCTKVPGAQCHGSAPGTDAIHICEKCVCAGRVIAAGKKTCSVRADTGSCVFSNISDGFCCVCEP